MCVWKKLCCTCVAIHKHIVCIHMFTCSQTNRMRLWCVHLCPFQCDCASLGLRIFLNLWMRIESRIICDHGYIRAKEIGRHGQPSADFAAPCAEATHSFCGEAWPYSVRSLVVILADFGPANALVSVRCKSLDSGVAFWWLRPKHGGIFGEEFWAFGPQIFEGWCWACSIDLVWRDSIGY